jgi:predicted membrane protein
VQAIVAVGFLQDVLRKLSPSQPVWMVGLVLVVFAVAVGAVLGKGAYAANARRPWWKELRSPIIAAVLLVIGQSVVAYVRTGSAFIAGLGAASYLSPIAALIVGASYASSEARVMHLLRFYSVLGVAAVSGVYLAYVGVEWKILEDVGTGIFVYSPFTPGRAIRLPAGFLRTPEVAAWHAAMSACVLVTIAIYRRVRGGSMVLYAAAAAFAGIGTILTGRRKSVVLVAVFAIIVLSLIVRMRRGRQAAVRIGLGLVVGVIFVAPLLDRGADEGASGALVDRASAVQALAGERFSKNFAGITQAFEVSETLFGLGAGVIAQGSQYAERSQRTVRFAANEGGVARVALELGLPGLIVAAWVVLRLGALLWVGVRRAIQVGGPAARLIICLLAMVLANGAVFYVGHQVFGDPLIYIFTGILAGILLRLVGDTPASQTTRVAVVGNEAAPGGARIPVAAMP